MAAETVRSYNDDHELFIASTIVKNDDVELIAPLVDRNTSSYVVDLCGGYGRVRLHWPFPVLEWHIIDKSKTMISFAQRMLPTYFISDCRYSHDDVTAISDGDLGKYDIGLCLYNSINEIDDLNVFFRSSAKLLKPNAKLFIRHIIFEDKIWPVNVTELGCFLSFKAKLWYSRAISKITDPLSNHQNLEIVFQSLGNERSIVYSVTRRIWSINEIDKAALSNGFSRPVHSLPTNYRVYVKDK